MGERTPHCEMTMGSLGLLFAPTATFSILRTVSMPSMTCEFAGAWGACASLRAWVRVRGCVCGRRVRAAFGDA
jgi:hypothetical protein